MFEMPFMFDFFCFQNFDTVLFTMMNSIFFHPEGIPEVGDDKYKDYVNSEVKTRFKTVKSLYRLSMEDVLNFPSLDKQICEGLPQLVRKDLISLVFKSIREPTFQLSSLKKLFETWSEERINVWKLAFKHRNMFGRNIDPLSVIEEDYDFNREVIDTVIKFIINKTISINSNNSKCVKIVDFTGISLSANDLETLLDADFTASEKTTLLLHVHISDFNFDLVSPPEFLRLLRGNHHFDFQIRLISLDGSVSTVTRNKYLDLCSNLDVLDLPRMNFKSWKILCKTLESIKEKCPNLSKLSLSENNLLENTGGKFKAKAPWINMFLKSFENLVSLNISQNNVHDHVSELLEGLHLQHLNVSESDRG